MTAIKDIWTDPSEYAVADLMADALTEILRGDTKLADWTDERIYRVDAVDPDLKGSRPPDIQVGAVSTAEQLRLNSEVQEDTALAIQIRWPVFFHRQELGVPTAATALANLKARVEATDNRLLGGTSASVEELAYQYLGFEFVNFEEFPLDDRTKVAVLQAQITYRSCRASGSPS